MVVANNSPTGGRSTGLTLKLFGCEALFIEPIKLSGDKTKRTLAIRGVTGSVPETEANTDVANTT